MKKYIYILLIIGVLFGVDKLYAQKYKLPLYYRKYLNIDSLIDGSKNAVYFYPEVKIYPQKYRKTRRDTRIYNKLVRNFKLVYPYALEIAHIYKNVDDTLSMFSDKEARRKYLNVREKQIMAHYKPTLKTFTLSQGILLVKLMDRETGNTAYQIVDDLRGSVTAVFWQTFALMFGNSLKQKYDPNQNDREIEYLVKRYQDGTL